MTGAKPASIAGAGYEYEPHRHGRRARELKNVSRNRPDATNLNHQYANRRVFISFSFQNWFLSSHSDSRKRGGRM
jgi:hypothetical protein